MKKLLLAMLTLALGAAAIGTSVASANGVARYQMQTTTITAIQPYGEVGQFVNVWTHTYNVTLNPCDSTFTGTGVQTDNLNVFYANETITGSFNANTVSYTATRSLDGLVYSLANAPLDFTTVTLATSNPSVPWALEFKVKATTPVNTTDYKNHGEYVAAQGGGSDAAHSCIGMPIVTTP
jgi:hypothetical protein